jgi:hypothetical protein
LARNITAPYFMVGNACFCQLEQWSNHFIPHSASKAFYGGRLGRKPIEE